MFDLETIRKDFPILQRKINGKPLIYFDSASTSQKPFQVINAIKEFYENHNANIHRSIYQIANEATEMYEDARKKVAKFINAKSPEEIVFVRNTTEAINLAAFGWGKNKLKAGERILLSEIEHHSNIVPWQILAKEKNLKLDYFNVDDFTRLDMDDFNKLILNAKLLAVTHVSNVTGTVFPVKQLIKKAHENGAFALIDGAQSVPHMEIDVQDLDCDFFAFSAHKMLGPTGIGVLYAKKELLDQMEPFIFGSHMIKEVRKDKTVFADLPFKFEAGTSNFADTIGFSTALDYLKKIGMKNIEEHERKLTAYSLKRLAEISSLKIYGPVDMNSRNGVISFNLGDIHSHDLASILDQDGIAVRSGHHCSMLTMERLGVSSTTRASFYLYNTIEEIDKLIESLEHAMKVFKIKK